MQSFFILKSFQIISWNSFLIDSKLFAQLFIVNSRIETWSDELSDGLDIPQQTLIMKYILSPNTKKILLAIAEIVIILSNPETELLFHFSKFHRDTKRKREFRWTMPPAAEEVEEVEEAREFSF